MSLNPSQLDEQLDLFLDGQLTGEPLAAFERVLAGDASLRERVERQRAINDSLRRTFRPAAASIGPELAGRLKSLGTNVPAMSDPPAPIKVDFGSRWRIVKFAAAAIVLITLGITAWQVNRPAGGLPRTDLADLYQRVVENGFKPAFVCTTDHEFAKTIDDRFGQPMLVAAAPNIELVGWAYGPNYKALTLSRDTLVLLAKVDQKPTLVFIDRKDQAMRPRFVQVGDLSMHKKELGDLVMYEVIPGPKSGIVDRAYTPKEIPPMPPGVTPMPRPDQEE
jgi:hypothetical protein